MGDSSRKFALNDYSLPQLIEHNKRLFTDRFGSDATVVAYSPGRINLIGEHTDYNGGFVLPMVH